MQNENSVKEKTKRKRIITKKYVKCYTSTGTKKVVEEIKIIKV